MVWAPEIDLLLRRRRASPIAGEAGHASATAIKIGGNVVASVFQFTGLNTAFTSKAQRNLWHRLVEAGVDLALPGRRHAGRGYT